MEYRNEYARDFLYIDSKSFFTFVEATKRG